MIVTISGYVESIKNVRQFKNTHLVEFIVRQEGTNRQHYYILRAVSTGESDAFKIESIIGYPITAECYLNGRKSDGDKGPYYSNDLQIKTLRTNV